PGTARSPSWCRRPPWGTSNRSPAALRRCHPNRRISTPSCSAGWCSTRSRATDRNSGARPAAAPASQVRAAGQLRLDCKDWCRAGARQSALTPVPGQPMPDPLFGPEVRLMLQEDDAEGMKAFCESLHPATVADALADELDVEGTWRFLQHTGIRDQAAIFEY